MSMSMAELIERGADLKDELLEFARGKRCGREFRDALVRRFGDPVIADEAELSWFHDWFVLQHTLRDGRTVVEQFVRARGDLPRADRDLMLGWRDVVEGLFEVEGLDGDCLVAVSLLDELRYRIRSNMGAQVFEPIALGSFLLMRVVPVRDEWLISGPVAVHGAEHTDRILDLALDAVTANPEVLFRNPERLHVAWELQREDRERFIEFFGSDEVVLPRRELSERLQAYWRARHGANAPDAPAVPGTTDAATVAAIYDAEDGLAFFADYPMLTQAFQHPGLMQQPAYRQIVRTYLHDATVLPLPLRRCAQAWPDGADAVFATLLRRPKFSWRRDGEELLRRHKPAYFATPPRPRFLPLGDRLTAHLERRKGRPESTT